MIQRVFSSHSGCGSEFPVKTKAARTASVLVRIKAEKMV